jgi:hypothetical protein
VSFPKSHDPRCTVCCEPSAVVDEDGRHFCGDCFLRHVMLRYGTPTETTAGLRAPESIFELARSA